MGNSLVTGRAVSVERVGLKSVYVVVYVDVDVHFDIDVDVHADVDVGVDVSYI